MGQSGSSFERFWAGDREQTEVNRSSPLESTGGPEGEVPFTGTDSAA